MTPEDLLSEWEGDDDEPTGMRAARVQKVRDDLMAATGEYVPRRISEIEALVLESPQRKAVITRKLREAVEGADEDE